MPRRCAKATGRACAGPCSSWGCLGASFWGRGFCLCGHAALRQGHLAQPHPPGGGAGAPGPRGPDRRKEPAFPQARGPLKGITRKKTPGSCPDVFFSGWIFENEGFCVFLPGFGRGKGAETLSCETPPSLVPKGGRTAKTLLVSPKPKRGAATSHRGPGPRLVPSGHG